MVRDRFRGRTSKTDFVLPKTDLLLRLRQIYFSKTDLLCCDALGLCARAAGRCGTPANENHSYSHV